jgi:hypothetical protein
MATRWGADLLRWLTERGWKAHVEEDKEVYGDQRVIDPNTNKPIVVYAAATIHWMNEGEYPDFLVVKDPKDQQPPDENVNK